jgi:hypothetical protein
MGSAAPELQRVITIKVTQFFHTVVTDELVYSTTSVC